MASGTSVTANGTAGASGDRADNGGVSPQGHVSSDARRRIADLAAIRILLRGESVVERTRATFVEREQVDAFLRLCGFDTDNSLDVERLHDIHHDAVTYLTETHGYRLPKEVIEPHEIHDLFLAATDGPKRVRRAACMTLKVMHITHHIQGRELVFDAPVSEAELLNRLNAKIFGYIDRARANGLAVREFDAGKKSRTSLVTKLLAKRGTLASQVFDRLRYRIVVEKRADLVRALQGMIHDLFPFNYVVPEQSQNGILGLDDLAEGLGLAREVAAEHWNLAEVEYPGSPAPTPQNEFSGSTYRCVNFVADIPMRIDDLVPEASPAIAFVQAEIQLVDAETEQQNNQGENAHPKYKERQLARVRRRLEGLGLRETPANPDPFDGEDTNVG